ncbi:MAG: hypothetical protein RHS_3293 [Robinsoniella sp. RHS]|nr:MAG: hypothetical protein RHS_3293 [Robinsoniella sp. RHS]
MYVYGGKIMKRELILKVEHLTKGYRKQEVLKAVDLEVEKGHIVGLLGRNGAGKTTLLKTILGLGVHYEGNIYFRNQLLDPEDIEQKSRIGSLVDVAFFDDLTACENLKIPMMITKGMGKREAERRIDEILEFVDLANAKKKRVRTFSFGMKQRLALAQALITQPELLVLDEPFVGLDPIGIEETICMLKQLCETQNTSIIFSSHQLMEVEELADEIAVLSRGKITCMDTYENIRQSGQSLIELMK